MSKIRNFFIQENPASKTTEKVASSIVIPTVQIPAPIPVQGVSDNKHIDLLEKAMEQQGTSGGHDYLMFKQALDKMKEIIKDEKTRFVAVFSTLSMQGCKKEELLSSLDHYINVIVNEKISFNNELKSEFSQKVQSKIDAVNQTKKDIDVLTKKIE